MEENHRLVATLKFKGQRFDDHGLDLDVLHELIAFRKVLLEAAKELWRRNNPGKERLPKGFDDMLAMKFYRITESSAAVPLYRSRIEDISPLLVNGDDVLDEAVRIVSAGLGAANDDCAPPTDFPIVLFDSMRELGVQLRDGEKLELEAPHLHRPVSYDRNLKAVVDTWQEPKYQDLVMLDGEVRSADLEGCRFEVRIDQATKIPCRFEPTQETIITEALRNHTTSQIRITGMAEYSYRDRRVIRITKIDTLELLNVNQLPTFHSSKPFWEDFLELAADVPESEWDRIPVDLSTNVDHYINDRLTS